MKLGLFICRAQPFHKGHLATVQAALENCNKLLILLGSSSRPPTIKNPFDVYTRTRMIENSLFLEETKQLIIQPIADFPYSDSNWQQEIRNIVNLLTCRTGEDEVILFGCDKDESTYYLRLFPEYKHQITTIPTIDINATYIRNKIFEDFETHWEDCVPLPVAQIISAWKEFDPTFRKLQIEWEHNKLAYSPIYVTTDNIIIQNDKLLLVLRKGPIGTGLWAFPGGYVEAKEWITEGAVRECKEETNLEMKPEWLKKIKVFDAPRRSQRGRVITHAHLWTIPSGVSLNPIAGDDAGSALWLDLDYVLKEGNIFMFEDHWDILKLMLEK